MTLYVKLDDLREMFENAELISDGEYSGYCTEDISQNTLEQNAIKIVHYKNCIYRTDLCNCGHPRHHSLLPTAYPYDYCNYGKEK